jgi:hypothetical protein
MRVLRCALSSGDRTAALLNDLGFEEEQVSRPDSARQAYPDTAWLQTAPFPGVPAVRSAAVRAYADCSLARSHSALFASTPECDLSFNAAITSCNMVCSRTRTSDKQGCRAKIHQVYERALSRCLSRFRAWEAR